MDEIIEGKASVLVFKNEKISRELPVFYNPKMKHNRDVTISILKKWGRDEIQACFPLAGSGIRVVRALLEVPIFKRVVINDKEKDAVNLIKDNLKRNGFSEEEGKIEVTKREASQLLLSSQGFDFIDIDPFGGPSKFLDATVRRISRGGILAVTATDTSSLAGAFPNVCMRRYWARPIKNFAMHETGIRILIRKVQLVASQYDWALTPFLSYFKDHYYRIFFSCAKSKDKANEIFKGQGMIGFCTKCGWFGKGNICKECSSNLESAGPLWMGKLFDKERISDDIPFLKAILEEEDIPFFYDISAISKKIKISTTKKMADIIQILKEKGFLASRTHFAEQGIKTNAPYKKFLEIIKI